MTVHSIQESWSCYSIAITTLPDLCAKFFKLWILQVAISINLSILMLVLLVFMFSLWWGWCRKCTVVLYRGKSVLGRSVYPVWEDRISQENFTIDVFFLMDRISTDIYLIYKNVPIHIMLSISYKGYTESVSFIAFCHRIVWSCSWPWIYMKHSRQTSLLMYNI